MSYRALHKSAYLSSFVCNKPSQRPNHPITHTHFFFLCSAAVHLHSHSHSHSSLLYSLVNAPFPLPSVYMTSSSGQVVALRKSRRLASPSDTATDVLAMPNDCELVGGTFVVFQWQRRPCILQVNLTQYCWGGHRSGALELVLEEHGLTHSPQLHHISSKLVSDTQWSWLREIFVVVRRLFDANEACDTVRKVHWLNVVECRLAYDLMLRQCHRYHCNLYPTGSLLGTHLKRYGVELDAWYGSTDGVVEPQTPSTPPSPAPQTTTPPSSADKHGADTRRSSLGEREWLSDIHLANLMFLLLHGQLDLPLERRDDFQCLYPMTDQLLMRTLAQAEPGSLLWHAKSGRGITVVLVNPDNNHWRLVVLDGLQRQVVLFDPLGRPLPESIVRAVGHFMGPTFRVTDMMLHVQAEGWNCGVWCLYVASRYIRAALSATVSTMMQLTDLHFSTAMADGDKCLADWYVYCESACHKVESISFVSFSPSLLYTNVPCSTRSPYGSRRWLDRVYLVNEYW